MTTEQQPVEEQAENDGQETGRSSRTPLIIAIAAIVGGVVLVCLFAALIFWPEGDGDGEDTAEQPTKTFDLVTQQFKDVVVVGVSDSETISVTLSTPVLLTVAGEEYIVETQQLSPQGDWSLTGRDDRTGVWVYGSIINYVFGLVDSEENQTLLNGLALGDEIVLATQGGTTYTFAFTSRELVDSDNQDIFAQHSPGATLVLVGGEDDQRLVVHGRYVVSDTSDADAGRVVGLGETAQLENLQITVTGVTYQFSRPEIPSGFAFYLVDFQIRNIGSTAVDAGQLRLSLGDDLGNLYAVNATASQLGNYRFLSGSIGAGQTVAATAGYQIPAGLTSSFLRWQVTRNDTGSEIEVNIPFNEGGDAGQQAAVQMQSAQVSSDGTSVLLLGQITNLGEQPLAVQEGDVSLASEGTVYLIFSTNPAFPWVIGPGQTIPFAVTFQRPAGPTAVFRVLNQPFQLSGLK